MKHQRGMFELYLGAALLLACAVCVILYQRTAAMTKELERAEAALQNAAKNEKVVTRYVQKIVEVQKRVPVVAGNLERLCVHARVPGPRTPDAAPAADAGHGPTLDALAADIGACQQNSAQLQAIQDALRPQLK